MIKYGLFVLALAGSLCQADIVDDALQQINRLADLTVAQKNSIARMSTEVQELVIRQKQIHGEALNRIVAMNVNMALRRAESMNCHSSVKYNVSSVSKTTLSNWKSCLEISDPVTQLIELGATFITQLEEDETMICQGLRNVTDCSQHTEAYDKFACVSESIASFTSIFTDNSKGLLYWFGQLDEVVQLLGLKIAQCLNIASSNMYSNIDSIFNSNSLLTHCSNSL